MDTEDLTRLSAKEQLAIAKDAADSIRTSLPVELYAGSYTLKSKLPFKVASFREVLLHRSSDLADMAIELHERSELIPAFVLTRGVAETAAMMYWLHKRTGEFLISRDSDEYDQFLMKGMLGSRDGTTRHESHNVLTALDHLDGKFQGFRSAYNALCEFTHPNWSGVMGAYSMLDTEAHTLRLGKGHRKPPEAFGLKPLIASLAVIQNYYNAVGGQLMAVNEWYEDPSQQGERRA